MFYMDLGERGYGRKPRTVLHSCPSGSAEWLIIDRCSLGLEIRILQSSE
jgi:hypothetical protein